MASWVIPTQTRLIGEGVGITIISASTSSPPTSGTILTMGSSAGSTGITIENLTLAGSGAAIGGILNQYAGQGSYVSHVPMTGVEYIGLLVGSSSGSNTAQNSGPYTDISFSVTSSPDQPATTCVQIINVGGTKGIHRITCLSGDTNAAAAIKIDSSSNSIEDVLIQGFADGILIGGNGIAQGNSISNVTDTTPATQDDATIHISGANTVSDLSVMGIQNSCTGSGCHSYTIADDVGQIKLSATTDPNLGMYVIGSNGAGFPFGRYTTSPSVPSWSVGSGAPNTSSSCAQGSIYSNTGSTGGSLWVCAPKSGVPTWQKVPNT